MSFFIVAALGKGWEAVECRLAPTVKQTGQE